MAKVKTLSVGDDAPAFELESTSGKSVSLAEFAGKKVVLYFYPKDDTPGCTVAACSFRDEHSALQKAGAVVLGVSRDTLASHGKFARSTHCRSTSCPTRTTRLRSVMMRLARR